MKVIIDTCCWIDYLHPKGNQKIKDIFHSIIQNHTMVMVGPILAELYSGNLSQANIQKLQTARSIFDEPVLSDDDWIQAGQLFYATKKKGYTTPLIDCTIAVIAQRLGAKVFTCDKHFEYFEIDELLF